MKNNDDQPIHLFFNRLLVKGYLESVAEQLAELDHQVIACESWMDLPNLLKLRPKSICFHSNELNYSAADDIVNMIDTMCRLVGLDYQPTITVGLSRDLDYELVKELRHSGIQGIVPPHDDWGWPATIEGLRAQWSGQTYWPRRLLEQLPGFRTMVKFVAPELPKSVASKVCVKLVNELPVEFCSVNSLRELFNIISNSNDDTDIVVLDINHCRDIEGGGLFDVINSLQTLINLRGLDIPIIGAVASDCDPALIKEALRCPGIRGLTCIYGGDFSFEDVRDSVKKYIAGDYTLHPKIKKLIRRSRVSRISKPKSTDLTTRQQQIYRLLITRGSSNKQIANLLKISESTVKLHISAILKKYNCRNRTQLSVFNR